MDDALEEIRALANASSDFQLTTQDTSKQHHLNAMARTSRDWVAFYKFLGREVDVERPFPSAPSEGEFMAFLQWLLATKAGIISAKLSTVTLKKQFGLLVRLVHERSNFRVSAKTVEKINRAIQIRLVQKGASQKVRDRPVAGPAVVFDMLYFLWALDEKELEHPRIRLQLSVSMLILFYLGIRPGELLESSAYVGSNEGILYKDLTVHVINRKGERRVAVLFKIRNQKFRREQEKYDLELPLLEDKREPHLCPVVQTLALAIADNALQGIRTLADFKRINPPVNTNFIISIRPEMAEVPLLRGLQRNGAISPTRIALACHTSTLMTDLGERAGYEDRFTPYALRRGHGNMLNKTVTSAVRRQRMGHASDDTFQHYLSSVSGVDTQAMMHERPPDEETMEFLTSMSKRLDLQTPRPLGSRFTDTSKGRRHRAQYLEEKKMYLEARQCLPLQAKPVPEATDLILEPQSQRPPSSRAFRAYARHDVARANVIQLFYHPAEGGAKLEDMLEPLISIAAPERIKWHYPCTSYTEFEGKTRCSLCGWQPTDSQHKDVRSGNLHFLRCYLAKEATKQYEKLQGDLVDNESSCRWIACKRPALSGRSRESRANHLACHVRSSRNSCRWDGCDAEFVNASLLKKHLLDDHKLPLPDTWPPRVEYCFECRVYCHSELDWNEHCRGHLEALDHFCGQVGQRAVVIVAALCPFCLGDETKTPAKRYHQFPRFSELHKHMSKHLEKVKIWPVVCPHPLCSEKMLSPTDFSKHAEICHGITACKTDQPGLPQVTASVSDDESSDDSMRSDSSVVSGTVTRKEDARNNAHIPSDSDEGNVVEATWDAKDNDSYLDTDEDGHELVSGISSFCASTPERIIEPRQMTVADVSLSNLLECAANFSDCDSEAGLTFTCMSLEAEEELLCSSPIIRENHQACISVERPVGKHSSYGKLPLRKSGQRRTTMICPRSGCIRKFYKHANLDSHVKKDHAL